MWRDFVTRISRKKKPPSVSSAGDSDVTGNYGGVTGGYNVSGHYSFHGQFRESSESESDKEDQAWDSSLSDESLGIQEPAWRDKYDFLLGLIHEPRLLLGETLSTEMLKLSLKRQAYMVEKILVSKSLERWEAARHNLPHWDTKQESEAAALRQQLQHLDKTLASLECRLEVLKAVHNALPPEFAATEDLEESEEPDSLEDSSVRTTSQVTETSQSKAPANVGDMMALLRVERLAHRSTRRTLLTMKKQYERLRDELEWRDSGHGDEDPDQEEDNKSKEKAWTLRSNPSHRSLVSATGRLHKGENNSFTSVESFASQIPNHCLSDELDVKERAISKLRLRVSELEKARANKIPLDTLEEIANLQNYVSQLKKDKEDLKVEIETIRLKYEDLASSPALSNLAEGTRNDPIGREAELSSPDNEPEGITNGDHGEPHADHAIQRKRTYKVSNDSLEIRQLRELLNELQSKEVEYKARIKKLEETVEEKASRLRELEDEALVSTLRRTLDEREKALEVVERYLVFKDEECAAIKRELETLHEKNNHLSSELEERSNKEREQLKSIEKLQAMELDVTRLEEFNKVLSEDCNRERVQRKKYFNTIEELKGKIRVFCRVRPLTASEKQHSGERTVAAVVDPYTVNVATARGGREFQFDRVFLPEESQETVFQDTHNLIQSAFDGYNVCICAYGQTGSGKTFTIVGDETQPGLAPRAFHRIFQLAHEYSAQFSVSISMYMLELYNDKLIDLLRPSSTAEENDRLDIKKDKKGIVWVQGSTVTPVLDAATLMAHFKRGLASRHTAATKMNDRSSRSHLVVGINVECTSRLHGTAIKGKVSLLDLAGSERIAKSGATSDQVREASSINKSLSTLGDVISALASNQSFVPYRNSKLTMLMQDSLGGNAKTLMFVNISSSHFNLDETLVSLTYASRVKQITNIASRNTESKEIARLKAVIAKLRRGEDDGEESS